MKGGNSSINGPDLDKNNIIKPTFGTLTEEGRKAFGAYCANLEEIFLSRYEMIGQGGHPQGHHADHHLQGRGNTRGTT
jgi:hypothetical protein